MRCQTAVALLLLLASARARRPTRRPENITWAVDGVREYLGRYVQCVTTSNGLEDCSSEFRRLSNAHTEFEKSVEEFRADVREQRLRSTLPPSYRHMRKTAEVELGVASAGVAARVFAETANANPGAS